MTGGVEAMLSENAKEGEPPPIVRLCRGEGVKLVAERLRRIVASIAVGDDPDLEIAPAMGVLLAVSMELIIRLRRYQEYPFKLCLLSTKWFPREPGNFHNFLTAP